MAVSPFPPSEGKSCMTDSFAMERGSATETGPISLRMGRPRGSATAKAKPGVGHNSKGQTPANLLLAFTAQALTIEAEISTLQASRKALFKRAKASGIDTKTAVKTMRELQRSPDEIAEAHNTRNIYRRALDLPHADLMQLETDISDPREREELARLEGRRAAYRGTSTASNPYDPGVPCGQAWISGFQEGFERLEGATREAAYQKMLAEAEGRD